MDDRVRIYGKINLDHGLRTTEFSLGMKKEIARNQWTLSGFKIKLI